LFDALLLELTVQTLLTQPTAGLSHCCDIQIFA